MCTEAATNLLPIKFEVYLSSHVMPVLVCTELRTTMCRHVLQNKTGFCLRIQLVHLQLQLEAF